MKIETINKYIFYSLIVIFFILPEPLQKIFRIGLGVFFLYYAYTLIYNRKISFYNIVKIHLLIITILLVILKDGFQTSIINILLCVFGVFVIKDSTIYNYKDERIFKYLYYLSIFSMILQLLFFRSQDGRPNLSYEINLSGAYLFLFFLLSVITKKRIGELFVIAASFLLLSRLLIFAIALYYVFILIRNIIPKTIFKISFKYVYSLLVVVFFIFNFWFLLNVTIESAYKSDASRVTELNDGSNKLRFLINSKVIMGLFIEKDEKFKFGYGQVSKGLSEEYSSKYTLMPHNELLVSVVEFGYVFTIICFIFVFPIYNTFFNRKGVAILMPLFLYSLILWVRFFIIPSFEMIFILYLLKINSLRDEKNSVFSSQYSFWRWWRKSSS